MFRAECARAKGVCPKCQTAPPAPQANAQSDAEAAANALADQVRVDVAMLVSSKRRGC